MKKHTATRRKKVVKHTKQKQRKDTVEGFGWEVIPFIVAILVSVVVIVQSMNAAREEMPFRPWEGVAIGTTHRAAPCNPDGAPLMTLRASERAYNRTLELLEAAQLQYDWDCSVDTRGRLCSNAKENLQRVNDLLRDQAGELQKQRIEACL